MFPTAKREVNTGARKGGRSESICRERSKQEFDNELSSRLNDAQIRLFIWKPGTITTCPPKSLPASSDPVQGILHTTSKKLCSHQILFQKSEPRLVYGLLTWAGALGWDITPKLPRGLAAIDSQLPKFTDKTVENVVQTSLHKTFWKRVILE